MPVTWGVTKQLWNIIVMEYYYAVRTEECDKYREALKDLCVYIHELIQGEVSRAKKTVYTVTITKNQR